MQKNRKVSARILSLTLSFIMAFAMMSVNVLAKDADTDDGKTVAVAQAEEEKDAFQKVDEQKEEISKETDNVKQLENVKPTDKSEKTEEKLDAAAKTVSTSGNQKIAVNASLIYVNPAYSAGGSDGSEAKPYTSVTDALDAASDGSTIKLSGNVSAEAVTINDRSLTIDLNGHTWSSEELLNPTILYQGTSGKSLLIQDTSGAASGVLSHEKVNNAVITNEGTGTVEINSGRIYNNAANAIICTSGTIRVSGGEVITSGDYKQTISCQNASVVEVSGGTISANGANVYAIHARNSSAVTITGGEVTSGGGDYSNVVGAENDATITVSGGMITTSSDNCHAIKSFSSGLVSISGGTVLATGTTKSNAVDTFRGKSTIKITGGNVGPNMLLSAESGTVKGNNETAIYKATVTIPDASDGTNVTGLTFKSGTSDYPYSLTGARTHGNKFYAYLPLGSATLVFNGKTYTTTVTETGDALFTSIAEKIAAAKTAVTAALGNLTATNGATSDSILNAVKDALSGTEIIATWDTSDPFSRKEATDTAAGLITGTIKLTWGDESDTVSVNLPIPRLTQDSLTITGGDSSHQIGSSKGLTFTCSGKLEDLEGIYIDAKLVDSKNYTLKQGSTILTLKASYLDTLSVGKHTLKLQYKDGVSAETTFTITAKAGGENGNTSGSPQTGDASSAGLLFSLFALSSGMIGFIICKKRRKLQ